jgi:hypothetical protein
MMTQESLTELTRQIMEQGYDRKTAGLYAAMIGDLPISDGHGKIVVQDEHGRELARIKRPKMFMER